MTMNTANAVTANKLVKSMNSILILTEILYCSTLL
jgi:hypothetical protein